MKKFIKIMPLVICGLFTLNSAAFADGLVFEPDDYPVSKAEASQSVYQQSQAVSVSPAVNTKNVTDIQNQVTRENNNMQDALFKLDSAQTDLRTQLLEYKAKYTELDNQFKIVKEQRATQKKLVNDTQKRINKLEKNKSQIRQIMQIQ